MELNAKVKYIANCFILILIPMRKQEIIGVNDAINAAFANRKIGVGFRGGRRVGDTLTIALDAHGVPVLIEQSFQDGSNTRTYLTFPSGESVKAFCERGHVLDPNGNDLTAGCTNVPAVLVNVVRTWVNLHPTDEVSPTITFEVTATDEVERYGRRITLYTWRMRAPQVTAPNPVI